MLDDWNVERKARRARGDGCSELFEFRNSRLREKEAACAVGESPAADCGSSSDDEDAPSCELAGAVKESLELYLLVGLPSFSGAAKVSAPIEGRDRKVLRLKLLSLDRRLEPPLGLVGVGGMSSALDWLSAIRFAVGDCVSDCTSSSPSILTKLPRRWSEPPVFPKIEARLPKLSIENLDTLALYGVLGVPNWCCGRADSPNRLPFRFTKGVSRF